MISSVRVTYLGPPNPPLADTVFNGLSGGRENASIPTRTRTARSQNQILATYSKTMQPAPPPGFLVNATGNGLVVPPLVAERFDEAFKYFCAAKRLVLDRELLHVKGKKVSLHALHAEIMKHRGYNVHQVRRLISSFATRPSSVTSNATFLFI